MADGEHDRDVHDGTGLGENEHDDSDEDRGGVSWRQKEVRGYGLPVTGDGLRVTGPEPGDNDVAEMHIINYLKPNFNYGKSELCTPV